MSQRSTIQDLFEYNDWANQRILELARDLSDSQLDAIQPMGFGSLRATLHHLAFAERLWLDRWLLKPWAPLHSDSTGVTVAQLRDQFASTAAERNQLIAKEQPDHFARMVDYQNSAREPFRHRLRELLVHVINHATHHRAQALNFLRKAGKSVPGGLDYLFFKLARPTVPQPPESVEKFRKTGLESSDKLTTPPHFDLEVMRRYCQYGNWCMAGVQSSMQGAPTDQWEHPFEMGPGNLKETLFHIQDAERWWFYCWTGKEKSFQPTEPTTSADSFWDSWQQFTRDRDHWLAGQTPETLHQPLTVDAEGTALTMRVGESLLQLCGHGTHHRAQAVNMIRRLGGKPPALDYVVWIRGPGAN